MHVKVSFVFLVGSLGFFVLFWVFIAVVVGLFFGFGFFILHYIQVPFLKAEGPCKQYTVLG